MSGLSYVGETPTAPSDITNRLAVNTIITNLVPSLGSVAAQAAALVGTTYATKVYVDSTHAGYATPGYYQSRDALNIPNASVGVAQGAASLNSSTVVPLAQLPSGGSGYLQGGWGPTAVAGSILTTDATPVKIADWNIGAAGMEFRPLVFLLAFVISTFGQPVIEVRISNSTTAPTTYGSTTLVAKGEGIYGYCDYHPVAALTAPDATGATPSLLPASYNVWLSAWIYDLQNRGVTINPGGIVTGAAYLLRGTL